MADTLEPFHLESVMWAMTTRIDTDQDVNSLNNLDCITNV